MPRSLVSTVQATTSFLKEAWFQGTPTWTTADIPDLSGQVFIVTGGNSGLGKDTVRVGATTFIFFSLSLPVLQIACRNGEEDRQKG